MMKYSLWWSEERRAVHSARGDKPTGSGARGICRSARRTLRGSHVPFSGDVAPRCENQSPYVFPSRAAYHPTLVRSFSPSLLFSFLRRDDGLLPAPPARLNPAVVVVVECSFASGEWSSGHRHERVSLVTNTARRSFSGSRRPVALTRTALRSDASSAHARIPRIDPRQDRGVPAGPGGEIGRSLSPRIYFSERGAGWGRSCTCRLDNAAIRLARR